MALKLIYDWYHNRGYYVRAHCDDCDKLIKDADDGIVLSGGLITMYVAGKFFDCLDDNGNLVLHKDCERNNKCICPDLIKEANKNGSLLRIELVDEIRHISEHILGLKDRRKPHNPQETFFPDLFPTKIRKVPASKRFCGGHSVWEPKEPK